MDDFFNRVIARAASIDELLSSAFEPLPGQKSDTDSATQRLAAWCRSCASGDWTLFSRRLERDGLSFAEVLTRFARVRRNPAAPMPEWIEDAIWIEAALQSTSPGTPVEVCGSGPVAFEELISPLVGQAVLKLCAITRESEYSNLTNAAHRQLSRLLLKELSSLLSEALYENFIHERKTHPAEMGIYEQTTPRSTDYYDAFLAHMRSGVFRRLFETKPVLLRLIAIVVRQWIDTTREFLLRLGDDIEAIHRQIFRHDVRSRVDWIEGNLSDAHNDGRSVLVVRFEGGHRAVYKPKDLRVDLAWYDLVNRLNNDGAPIDLRAARVVERLDYGWTEFIEHTGCGSDEACERFFRRAGAWLALFHCFAASDMHEENIIAAGEHPVPIDLEVLLQPVGSRSQVEYPESKAFEAAVDIIDSSVAMVGLLPTYKQAANKKIYAMGGLVSDWNVTVRRSWRDVNTDTMRPTVSKIKCLTTPNLPHVGGRYRELSDHVVDLELGFREYAQFLGAMRNAKKVIISDEYAGLVVRKIIRPTEFYYLILKRLRDHRTMGDGVTWSAQADFQARLANWDEGSDPLWSLQRVERAALLTLNVPHLTCTSDGGEICETGRVLSQSVAVPGLSRAHAHISRLDEPDIAWQIEVIRHSAVQAPPPEGSTSAASGSSPAWRDAPPEFINPTTFLAEADKIAVELKHSAIRRGPAAAWIGLGWVADSEAAQLAPLGADLYNGVCGIGLFLAAHGAITGNQSSIQLAMGAVAHLRGILKSRNAARLARFWGTGAATGLGSIVYALTVMAKCLGDEQLLRDAHGAARLFSDDLIEADRQLDVLGGCAGGILALLRLHRDSGSEDVLERATRCGEHLLAHRQLRECGERSFGSGSAEARNGMARGAGGIAYALTSLAQASRRKDFYDAALECLVFENTTYEAVRKGQGDPRGDGISRYSRQWCHDAVGIGIARAAMAKVRLCDHEGLVADVQSSLVDVLRLWPGRVDNLCRGTLGVIELLHEGAAVLRQPDLRAQAAQRMTVVLEKALLSGDYRWEVGDRRFNIGFYRGISGVGYTLLRRIDCKLPNVLMFE